MENVLFEASWIRGNARFGASSALYMHHCSGIGTCILAVGMEISDGIMNELAGLVS